VHNLGDPWRPPRPPPSDCVVIVPGTVSYYSRSKSGGVLKGAGDGEVGLLAGGGCAHRGKRQRSDGVKTGVAATSASFIAVVLLEDNIEY